VKPFRGGFLGRVCSGKLNRHIVNSILLSQCNSVSWRNVTRKKNYPGKKLMNMFS
jgi:hypothetical protein